MPRCEVGSPFLCEEGRETEACGQCELFRAALASGLQAMADLGFQLPPFPYAVRKCSIQFFILWLIYVVQHTVLCTEWKPHVLFIL